MNIHTSYRYYVSNNYPMLNVAAEFEWIAHSTDDKWKYSADIFK